MFWAVIGYSTFLTFEILKGTINKKLLVIGFVWPEPQSSAAGCRMMQLVTFFKDQGYQITFASTCTKTDRAFPLETIGVKTVFIDLNSSTFDVFVKELDPGVVLFDRFMVEEQFGWRVTEQCPNALKILDTEDLHCLRKGRHQAYRKDKAFNKSFLFNDVAKREIASIYRCDLSLVISEAEMEILKTDFKLDSNLLLYLPFMLDPILKEHIENLPEFNNRNHFISIGNFLHEPNYNAVLYLKEILWPLIKKQLPKAEIHIYGAYASPKVNQLNNRSEGFFVKGFAEHVNGVMRQAKVCLAPIRFGAGLKGKLVDAMLNGTPCVTTTVGAEGMFGNMPPNGFIVDRPEEFVEKAVHLFTDEQIWKDKQDSGFKVINNRFDKRYHQQRLLSVITETADGLYEKRRNNFIGQMLQHHLLQSTKYMSKWIEEKNLKN